jgi:hypothetical protein
MGNAKSKYAYGHMIVQTSQQIYNPGSQISGSIYLRVTAPAPARQVLIEVKGTEKVGFVDFEYKTHEGRQERVEVKRKHERTIFMFTAPCFTFTVPQLQPGDYTIPFSFVMPPNLPSSLQFIRHHMTAKPKAMVKYQIKGSLVDDHAKVLMKHKQVLILREMGESFETNITRTDEHNITTWCCVNQGSSRITTNFEKNVMEPHDTCKAFINIDNSLCNLNMAHVSLSLEQEITMTVDRHRWAHTFTLT